MLRLPQHFAAAYAASSQIHWLSSFRFLHSNANGAPIPGQQADSAAARAARATAAAAAAALLAAQQQQLNMCCLLFAEVPKQWLDEFIPTAPLPANQSADTTGTSILSQPQLHQSAHQALLHAEVMLFCDARHTDVIMVYMLNTQAVCLP
jgi:hypothetical protein